MAKSIEIKKHHLPGAARFKRFRSMLDEGTDFGCQAAGSGISAAAGTSIARAAPRVSRHKDKPDDGTSTPGDEGFKIADDDTPDYTNPTVAR
jgi:hypothetical protein